MFHSFLSIAFYLTFGNSLSHASCWYLSSRKNGRRRRNQWFLLMPPFTTTSLTWLCKIYLAHYDSQKSLFHFLCHFLLSLILGERHFVIWNFSQAPVYLKKKSKFCVSNFFFLFLFYRPLQKQIDRASTRMHGLLFSGTFGALPQLHPVHTRFHSLLTILAVSWFEPKSIKLLASNHLWTTFTRWVQPFYCKVIGN